jgi:hypothetical protein
VAEHPVRLTAKSGYLVVRQDQSMILLSPDDIALILQRLVQEDQLHVMDTVEDTCYDVGGIEVRTDDDGRIYLCLGTPAQWPEQQVSLADGYVDESGRVCNPFGC